MGPGKKYYYYLDLFESFLSQEAPSLFFPESLRVSCMYSAGNGGKRIRPVLLLSTLDGLNYRIDNDALKSAMAIEFVHTYSLIHDDLPSMDNDDLRRGKPSLHKYAGEDMAILAGDALLTAAFSVLSSIQGDMAIKLVRELSSASLGMVSGQVMDTCQPRHKDIKEINFYKTSLMLELPFKMAMILSGMKENSHIVSTGKYMGEMFQVVDDLLDVTGNLVELGKTPGKDRLSDKRTIVDELGIEGTRNFIEELRKQTIESIESTPLTNKDFFKELTDFMATRSA
ncbi:MAG: polyprenyl synthetase family protein [Deltaproteobacteria bacterium]|nr:polyprenyl synthetase family protein [Deltaproteobacteria bacterium]